MRILITNDDGIQAPGIKNLVGEMTKVGDVFVVAPEGPQSAGSHATTLHKPLRALLYPLGVGEIASFKVSGSPADCVVLALDVLVKEQIDIVVSGINAGPNLGDDVIYSGTVAGAREGAINGKLSIAFSVNSFLDPDFSYASVFAAFFSKLIVDNGLPGGLYLNVNLPNIPKGRIKGYKYTKLSRRRYANRVTIGQDPFGTDFYWIGGKLVDQFEEGTDSRAVQDGYIAITPLFIDQTDYVLLPKLENLKFSLP
jgi:5'-nucleotidase